MKTGDSGWGRRWLKKRGIVILLWAAVLVAGCTGKSPVRPEENPVGETVSDEAQQQKIFQQLKEAMDSGKTRITIHADEIPGVCQQGDLVMVDFTARLDNGEFLATTVEAVAAVEKSGPDNPSDPSRIFRPAAVLAGEGADLPGMAQAVLDMKTGERKTVAVPPPEAFGVSKSEDIKQFPLIRRTPKTVVLEPREYIGRFQRFPVQDKTVMYNPYLSGRVAAVDENRAELVLTPIGTEGQVFQEPFGTIRIQEEENAYVVTLTPQPGAVFEMQERKGRIVAADGEQFSVDFNHPLADKTLNLEIEVKEIVKASAAWSVSLDWLEDYDAGVKRGKAEQKPMVLFLFADWCEWCRKFKEEVFTDPRITSLKDHFVWVKLNSDIHREYKESFEQTSFPKLLVLDPGEAIMTSFEGFRDATALRATLVGAMERMEFESGNTKNEHLFLHPYNKP
ncbi:MAG: thioredoxin family protein [Thermodesulfobacteriota bacterium]